MQKYYFLIAFGFAVLATCPARAEWVNVSQNLSESDCVAVVAHPKDSKILFAASMRRLYRTDDGGHKWKQVVGLRGSDVQIRALMIDAKDPRVIYVASDKGIQVSKNSGLKWETLYRGIGSKSQAVYSLASDTVNTDRLWAGTDNGLVFILLSSGEAYPAGGLPELKVFSVLTEAVDARLQLWVSTDKGIYKSENGGNHWQRVQVVVKNSEQPLEASSLSQFQIEELMLAPSASNLIRFGDQDKMYAILPRGIFQASQNGDVWEALANVSLPSKQINYLSKSSRTFYAATDQGVFQWDEKDGMRDISAGLPSRDVRMLFYDEAFSQLYAATKKGIYRYPHPEYTLPPTGQRLSTEKEKRLPLMDAGAQVAALLKRFDHEPSIAQIQNAAIEYAEVHPDKIRRWREQATQKAWLPNFSLTTHSDSNQNVDIDRGGTGDPDKFIVGPAEKGAYWTAGLSWSFGDLIWNDDQTSIDTRSRLMVELRDDVLNEVTHFYFERRRLQLEMLLSPARELPLQLERQIKLDELTANIDALTGGFMSKKAPPPPKIDRLAPQ